MIDLPTNRWELLTLKRRVDAALKAFREKAERPAKATIKRAWPKRKRKGAPEAYVDYIRKATFCYGCKRETAYLDPAHFVKSGGVGYRVLDLRVVIPLCRMCHTHQESRDGVKGYPHPKLSHANMAWLKRRYEPENYDPDFIKASNRNVAIEPVRYP